jgi:hypothetical protein
MNRWLGLAMASASIATSASARAEPLRILIAASHSRGVPGELPLQHAADDARHVERALTSLGGFAPSATTILVDPKAETLLAAIERARALAATHPPDEVTFLFYFSGHGDKDKIHLGDESIAMTDLADRVRDVPASLRLLVTDACRNYPTHAKGVTTEPGFALAGGSEAEAKGVVWLFASGEGEPAQESDELEGALFTHYWVSGLRGAADANGDGRVTLAESYDFAYSQTLLRSARSSGVLQHPAAVFALREAAPIVLTRTFGANTLLRFPQGADAHYLVYALGSHVVFGEIWGSPERSAAMALPPGSYLVQRRAGDGSAAVDLSIGAGEEHSLRASDFHAVTEEQVAAKGGDLVLRPRELGIEVDGGASRLASYAGLARLRFGYRLDHWALSLSALGVLGEQDTSAEDVHVGMFGGEATIERRLRLGGPVLGLGLGAEADAVWQTLDRTDAARVALAGYATSVSHTAFAAGPVAVVRFHVPLTRVLWAEAAAHGGVLVSSFDGAPGALWTASAGLGVGFDF